MTRFVTEIKAKIFFTMHVSLWQNIKVFLCNVLTDIFMKKVINDANDVTMKFCLVNAWHSIFFSLCFIPTWTVPLTLPLFFPKLVIDLRGIISRRKSRKQININFAFRVASIHRPGFLNIRAFGSTGLRKWNIQDVAVTRSLPLPRLKRERQ